MKLIQFSLLLVMAGILLYTVSMLPPRGDLNSPVQQVENPVGTQVAGAYYIQHAYLDTKTPNMVCVVLADYRSTDTFGELIVVFAGTIGCIFILRRRRQ